MRSQRRGPNQNMNTSNPFASRGYVEKDGELVKLPNTEQTHRVAVSKAALSEFGFKVGQSKDEHKLNKTEKAYLTHLRRLGSPYIGVQNVTFKLGDDCRFTPDFSYLDENGRLVFVDVKGFQRDDALVKIKVAARLFPLFDFVIVKKTGLSWATTKVNP